MKKTEKSLLTISCITLRRRRIAAAGVRRSGQRFVGFVFTTTIPEIVVEQGQTELVSGIGSYDFEDVAENERTLRRMSRARPSSSPSRIREPRIWN
ncbi:MAG: hypothetical protein GY866_11940 [Proteobacteria bacterium]|nr:hypothetical protein [Pseudomonadota bacterium]